jgi:peptide/nickel transport system substrate-binding protein
MMRIDRRVYKDIKVKGAVMVLLLILSCIFTGCIKTESGAAVKTVHQEIVVPAGKSEASLDPFDSNSMQFRIMVYNTLVTVDRNGTHPSLATSWETSPDYLTWTFHLRQGVKFHDGTPFDAYAANFSINKALKDTRSYKFEPESIQATDNNTIVIKLKKTHGPFLLDMSTIWMISPNNYGSDGKFKEAIGTGPFIPVTITKQEIVFKGNDEYWDGAPKLEKVTVKMIPDATTQIMSLEAGEVDLIGADISNIRHSQIARFKNDPNYKTYSYNTSEIVLLGINANSTFFKDKRVREAINYGIDRQAIIDNVLEGYGVAAKGPIGYDASIPMTNTNIQGYTYNPEKAKQLLKEAGWEDKNGDGILEKDGKPFEITFVNPGTYPYLDTMCEVIQSQLLKIGVKANIRNLEGGAFTQSLIQKTFDLAVVPNYGKYDTDPYPYMFMFFHSKGTYSLMNSSSFDRTYYQAMAEVNPEKRKVLYDQMQDIVMQECNFVFLFHPTKVGVSKKDVQNFELMHGWNGYDQFRKVYRGDQ